MKIQLVSFVVTSIRVSITFISDHVFLLHLLLMKAKFCANKPSDKVSIKSGYLTDGLPNAICHDVSDWKGFCWCHTRDKGWRRHIGFGAGRAFVLSMESKHTHLLHLLYYCCVETFVQIQDLAISNIPVIFVRKQLELTKMESCATCVRDGFIQEDNV